MTAANARACRVCARPISDSNKHCDNPQCDWCQPCVSAKEKETRGQ